MNGNGSSDKEIGWAQEYRVEMSITAKLIRFNRESDFSSVLFEILVTAAESHTTKDVHITCGDENIGTNKKSRNQCLGIEMKYFQGFDGDIIRVGEEPKSCGDDDSAKKNGLVEKLNQKLKDM